MSVTTAHEDLAGLSPIYYNPGALDRGFVVAPENAAINPQIDKATLAASILWPGFNPLVEGYSYFEGVQRLRPGESATLTDDALSVRYEYPDESADATFSGTAGQLGAALRNSVQEVVTQAPDRTSTDFSGGLDSTPLGLSAADLCSAGNSILGLVQYNPDYPAGDIRYARQFAKLSEKLILRELVTGDSELPFAHLPSADISPSEPYRGTDIFAREAQRLAEARTYHITGVGGDALFDPEPTPIIVDLLLNGENDLARELALYTGRATHQNPADILERARVKAHSNIGQSLERTAVQLTSNNLLQPSGDWLPSLGVAAQWLTPEMREAVAARARDAARRTPNMSFVTHATRQAIADSGDAHRHMQMLAEQYGVRLVAPYLGDAAIRAVLALPAATRIQPGQFKPLLRAASAAVELAPDEVFAIRIGKGAYSDEMRAGFDRALPDIKAMLQHSRLTQLGIINPDAIIASLSQRKPPLAPLARLIACENWLAHLGIDAPEPQSQVSRRAAESHAARSEVALPPGNFGLVASLHIVAGPNGQVAAFDPERGVFLPPVGRSRTTRLILQSLSEHNSPQATVALLRQEYPHVAVEQLASDVTSTIYQLTEHGWLRPIEAATVQPTRLPVGAASSLSPVDAGEVMRVRVSTLSLEDVTETERDAIERAYASVRDLVANDVPFTELTRYLTEANSRAVQSVSHAEALHALELARLVTMNDDQNRVACYELSLTAALFCMSSGLSVDWCLGLSFGVNQPSYHAWLEAEGIPVRGEADELIQGVYQRVLRVGNTVTQ